jgi:uncharacterized RDD family membrane protein YckC
MEAVHDLGNGIYFARQDYAGLFRRLAIIAVDLMVVLGAGFSILFVWSAARPDDRSHVPLSLWLAFAYLYLTVLRGSRFRTIGYLLTGVRIVNLKGERPSFFWINVRLILWVIAPGNLLVDLAWWWGDVNRQTLRDRIAGTYVVGKNAVPIGTGPIRPTTLFVLGYCVVFPEVIRPLDPA